MCRYVKYHSELWGWMADNGWFTWTVDDNGIACMKRRQQSRYCYGMYT